MKNEFPIVFLMFLVLSATFLETSFHINFGALYLFTIAWLSSIFVVGF